MDKTQLDNCLKWIKNEKIKEWTEEFLKEKAPDYFWEIEASSTGKYHPSYAVEKGGLVKHTKVVFQIALDMLDNKVWGFSEQERDIILAAILLHDVMKRGVPETDHTVHNHGTLVSNKIHNEGIKENSIRAKIANTIASHMGQWNKDFNGNKVAPLPSNEKQFFVHLCDYIASRKYMEINFERMKV